MRARPRTLAALCAVAALAVLAAGCGSSSSSGASSSSGGASSAAASAKVAIANFAYAPKPVVVRVGGSVTFTNTDAVEHTATSNAGNGPASFDTGTLTKGQSKTISFTKPGTYQYVCLFHAFMHGIVIVR